LGRAVAKIGFDARYIHDQYHGIGRYAYNTIEALTRIDPSREYVMFTGRGKESRFNLTQLAGRPNIKMVPGPWPLYWPQEQLKWPGLLKQHKIDLFHSPYIVVPALRRRNLPVLITIHDLIFDRYPHYMPSPWFRPLYQAHMRLGIQVSSKVICVSEATQRDLEKYYRVDRASMVIPEGVDDGFSQTPNRNNLNVVKEKYLLRNPFILTVGARRPHKNHPALVQAFAQIAEHIPHDLVFVGPPDARFLDQTAEAVKLWQIQHRVRFLDWVPEDDLPAFYRMADVVVLPSMIEGFGLPALEAMASGTVVIASGNTSFAEVMGDTGVLIDPVSPGCLSDEILKLLSRHPAERHRLGLAGRERAKSFTWERTAQKIKTVYDEILE
jgi:glycosyltransferase involved in cell wall biosynthesis